MPGVKMAASKVPSRNDTPDSARTAPAAPRTVPNTNKSKYIRPTSIAGRIKAICVDIVTMP
jgi:hypothetical protein